MRYIYLKLKRISKGFIRHSISTLLNRKDASVCVASHRRVHIIAGPGCRLFHKAIRGPEHPLAAWYSTCLFLTCATHQHHRYDNSRGLLDLGGCVALLHCPSSPIRHCQTNYTSPPPDLRPRLLAVGVGFYVNGCTENRLPRFGAFLHSITCTST